MLVAALRARDRQLGLEQARRAYLLALYRALLQPLYPGKTISAVLLFTEAPRLSLTSMPSGVRPAT